VYIVKLLKVAQRRNVSKRKVKWCPKHPRSSSNNNIIILILNLWRALLLADIVFVSSAAFVVELLRLVVVSSSLLLACHPSFVTPCEWWHRIHCPLSSGVGSGECILPVEYCRYCISCSASGSSTAVLQSRICSTAAPPVYRRPRKSVVSANSDLTGA
jgi:hypothetical protein